jgi:hypothetical protein
MIFKKPETNEAGEHHCLTLGNSATPLLMLVVSSAEQNRDSIRKPVGNAVTV